MGGNDVNPLGQAINPQPSRGEDAQLDTDVLYRGIHVGTGGDIEVDMPDGGENLVIKTVSGQTLPYIISRIHSAGTTATDIIGFF